MAAVDNFDEVVEQYHLALNEFLKANPEPLKKFFSHRDDVTLANPLVGLPARGWEQVAATLEHASSQFTDGENVGFETIAMDVSPELAYVLLIERDKVKIAGSEDIAPSALRVTMVFRPEDGEWKVVHRHADPITTPQQAESVIQE
jgi:ketosteroid isomerase-like protein